MYQYRNSDSTVRRGLLSNRRLAGLPLHSPKHQEFDSGTYLITAANYEHAPIMSSVERRGEWEDKLLQAVLEIPDSQVFAWCILPNHFHLLAKIDLAEFRSAFRTLTNRTSTQWNKEDNMLGRKVWYEFMDRGIRNERHLFVAFNYVHANPVKHGYVQRAIH